MKALIFSDLHIRKDCLSECSAILNEIVDLSKEKEVDIVVNLGDTFDSTNPGNESLDLFAKFIEEMPKPLINIVAYSHESVEETNSILNHYGILNKKACFYPYSYSVDDVLFGHFMLQESLYGFKEKENLKTLCKYKAIFLGHQHTYQEMNNAIHVGSCRYVTFAEEKDTKYFIIFDLESGSIEKIKVKSCIPMMVLDVEGMDKEPEEVLTLPKKLKLKITFSSKEWYKKYIPYFQKFEQHFKKFSHQLILDTDKTEVPSTNVAGVSFESELIEWANKNITDEEVKKALLSEIKYANK